MSIRRSLLALTLVLAACGGDSTDTSMSLSPTTTLASTTTTSLSSTTTTTDTEISTTTMAQTTTSTNSGAGDWADQPVIVSGVNGMALGWWDGSDWIEASGEVTVPTAGGDDYQTVVLDSLALSTGAAPTEAPDFCSLPFLVELEGPDLIAPDSGDLGWAPYGFAISAPWDLTPNEVAFQPTDDPSHEAVVAEHLARRGIDEESPRIRQTAEADLDGDGAVETVIVADGDDSPVIAHDGYYSLVAHLDSDGEMTVVAEGTDGFPVSYRIGGIADLNGDGTMEIVLSTLAIESMGTAVYEWIPGEQRFDLRFVGGCGA